MQIDDVSKAIKHSKLWGGYIYIFKCPFSFSNMLHSFSKFERILGLMIKRANGVEIGEIHFYNTFEHLWFKHVFDPKNQEF
jgi:hypothetical protein